MAEAFSEVFIDKKLLKNLTMFGRDTGLESVNGMLLKYTTKRNAFEYDYIIAWTGLVATSTYSVHTLLRMMAAWCTTKNFQTEQVPTV